MRTQKVLRLTTLSILLLITTLSTLAVGCSGAKQNELQRPIGETNQISNTVSDTTTDSSNGEVAGLETVILPTKNIKINETNIKVELADNNTSRTQGLSNRKKLDEGKGMLFDFLNSGSKKPGFWMKDMLISIDMIWINNTKIIGITSNIPLPSKNKSLEVYYPPSEITHVLEVPAGWSAKNNFKVGDTVQL